MPYSFARYKPGSVSKTHDALTCPHEEALRYRMKYSRCQHFRYAEQGLDLESRQPEADALFLLSVDAYCCLDLEQPVLRNRRETACNFRDQQDIILDRLRSMLLNLQRSDDTWVTCSARTESI